MHLSVSLLDHGLSLSLPLSIYIYMVEILPIGRKTLFHHHLSLSDQRSFEVEKRDFVAHTDSTLGL